MKIDDPRIKELTAALEKAERKLADRETLIAAAIGQTETARSQYEQANERAETLRRRLDEKEDQLRTLQSKLAVTSADPMTTSETLTAREQRISSLQQELQQRDQRIAALEQLCAEDDNALHAINQDAKRQNLANPSERLLALGLVMESLEKPGLRHKIGRVTTTIGRANNNDIAIDSTSVSRYHARLVIELDALYLVDLQSTNGCSVNDQRVSRHLVGDGDVIAIGDAKFRLTSGVSLAVPTAAKAEDRSMDETNPLLDDAVVPVPAARTKPSAAQPQVSEAKPKTK